jgi:hypothetical protein
MWGLPILCMFILQGFIELYKVLDNIYGFLTEVAFGKVYSLWNSIKISLKL